MPRISGEDTKSLIKAAALDEFSARGSDVPLDDIARTLGITRSAILHHFGSKAALSQEIVAGFQVVLDDVLGSFSESTPPLTGKDRARLLSLIIDAYYDHRKVVIMILRDVPTNWSGVARQILRLIELLAGPAPSANARLIADSVIGVIVRPLIDPTIDSDHEYNRELIAAMATQLAKWLDKPEARAR